MSNADFCLRNPHSEHVYSPLSQALKLVSKSFAPEKFSIFLIRGFVEGRNDAPVLLQ